MLEHAGESPGVSQPLRAVQCNPIHTRQKKERHTMVRITPGCIEDLLSSRPLTHGQITLRAIL